MRLVSLESVHAPFTPEELQQADAALAHARQVREALLDARGGRLFPRAEDDLDELRDEGGGDRP